MSTYLKLTRFGVFLSAFTVLLLLDSTAFAQRTYRLSKAPFYKTFDKKAKLTTETRTLHYPVQIDQMTIEEFFYEGREDALRSIIAIFNAYLDSLSWSAPLVTGQFPKKGAPYLFVGSSESVIAPPSAEMLREEFDKFPPMALHVDKPDKNWKGVLNQQMTTQNTDYALIFWIGFNEYPKANKGLFKKKVVLGTDYEPEIRFLSAELEPVEVLQIYGMLLDKQGDIIRAGSEAFLYEDTPFWVQMFGASTSIDDNTLSNTVSEIRREDLPGKPLAWKVAIHNLLQKLTQRPMRSKNL